MKLTNETKLFIGIIIGTIILVTIAALTLTKPAPSLSRSDLILPDSHTEGNPKAKAYLVEFSDFECPACGAAEPTVAAIVKQYKDKLLFVYRHFPLSQHQFAERAAEAAEAANAQGKFWEMHDLLFANQDKFSDTYFDTLAKQLNLDMTKFDAALSSGTYANRVNEDVTAGTAFGVDATPTFFLNGQKLDLTSFNDFQTAVANAVK